MSITLHARDLFSKHGFSDGDLLDDFLWDHFNETHPVASHELLELLIREHLVPVLPVPLELERIISIHNPIRVADCELERYDLGSTYPDTIVVIEDGVVLQAVQRMLTSAAAPRS